MDIKNTQGQDLRKKVLWGLGILIIVPVIISLIQYFSIENQITDGWVFYTKQNSDLNDGFPEEVVIDESGRAWISTHKGVSVYDGESWQTYSMYSDSMGVDPQGRVWVLSDKSIFVFDGKQVGSPSKVNFDNRWKPYLIALDPSGNAWIATNEGIRVFDGESWSGIETGNLDFGSVSVTAITFDELGRAWIGTREGLSIYDGETWQLFNTTNSDIPGNVIQEIVFDDLGNAWIGTYYNGVSVFDGENWENYNKDIFGSGYVLTIDGIAFDSDGQVIVLHNFLSIFNGTDWIKYDVWNSGLANASGNDIAIDLEGRIWITSYYGVNVATLDYASPNAGVSQNRYDEYENSFLDWKFLLFPVIGLSIIWAAIYLEDFVILVLGFGIFVISLGVLFDFLIIGEFGLILLFTVLLGCVVGGLVGSIKRRALKQAGRFSVILTVIGILIGAFIGFIAGIFLIMLATSY